MNKQSSNEFPALALSAFSAGLGVGYYLYISAIDFPNTIARAIPFLWLILAVAALILAVRVPKKSYLSYAAISLSIASLLFALVFVMAAIIGD